MSDTTGITEVTSCVTCNSFVIQKIFPKYSLYRQNFLVFFPTERPLLKNATLIESAAACVSKPVEKILLDKVEVITGEEAEQNVLQVCIS